MFRLEPHTKITLYYVLFGAAWIFGSDTALAALVRQPAFLSFLQTIKGWIFILVTAVFLYVMILRSGAALREREQEKKRIYDATLSAMHHILNNFLNQMMLFRVEAEKTPDFDPEILGYYDEVIGDAQNRIARLESVAEVTAEAIRGAVFSAADVESVAELERL